MQEQLTIRLATARNILSCHKSQLPIVLKTLEILLERISKLYGVSLCSKSYRVCKLVTRSGSVHNYPPPVVFPLFGRPTLSFPTSRMSFSSLRSWPILTHAFAEPWNGSRICTSRTCIKMCKTSSSQTNYPIPGKTCLIKGAVKLLGM